MSDRQDQVISEGAHLQEIDRQLARRASSCDEAIKLIDALWDRELRLEEWDALCNHSQVCCGCEALLGDLIQRESLLHAELLER